MFRSPDEGAVRNPERGGGAFALAQGQFVSADHKNVVANAMASVVG